MNSVTIEKLPFYWRLSPSGEPRNNIVDNYYPFVFSLQPEYGLVIQERNVAVLDALEKIYQQEYNIGYLQDANEIARPYGADFVRFLDKVLTENPGIHKILEIGCGGCVILEGLKKRGYDVVGVDSSPFAAKEGAKKGVKVVTAFFPTSLVTEKFDLAFNVDVLEHIHKPLEFLQQIRENLNPDGIVIVNVPDATESIEIGDISMAMHQHLNYFTEDSLSALLSRAGFDVLNVIKAGYGGSLYAAARRSKTAVSDLSNAQENPVDGRFSVLTKQVLSSFDHLVTSILLDKSASLGFYVPLRTLPYIAMTGRFSGFRFFDDTNHWHYREFDGVPITIENFADLQKKPVTHMLIMSLTFGDVIQKKIHASFGNKIKTYTLSEIARGTVL
ncbi:MAG: class I SAM-dependent methyltransferase [Proteobacteria bacterium]|nr:class I SAM-dependent methyltransferase [Pseudomonadota bacterium]